ncbi:MAG: glycosyltransferase family 2 protein, partial [candidate division WOR-3 bacterium]
LLNPDTRVEPGALDIMAEYLDRHPDVGAVAPRLLNPDGSTQLSIRGFPTVGSVLCELLGLSRLFPGHQVFDRWRLRGFNYEQEAEVEQPMASCLLVRRQVVLKLGGFDERFPIFYNDVDLSFRMRRAGWRTVYLPNARVYHRLGASTGQVKVKMVWEAHRSLFRFLELHDPSRLFWLKAVILLPLLELAALVRVLFYRLAHQVLRPATWPEASG